MNQVETVRKIRAAMPDGGLLFGKTWRISPEPFPLDKKTIQNLERLGPLLFRFQNAADQIYRRSRKGGLPGWIAENLDQGKPERLLELGLAGSSANQLPRVIRPDLILTEDGFIATELDSVPGGIGLTAWLGQIYQQSVPQARIVGGAGGMLSGFKSIFTQDRADILFSTESKDYRPEMEWLTSRLEGDFQVKDAETYFPTDRDIYRFFELFDLPNIRGAEAIATAASQDKLHITSPFKPWLEEKMWSALLWSIPLQELWRQELRESNYLRLRQIFPRSWIVDPTEIPHHAAIPGLEIQSFEDLKKFSQKNRELVLKLSGFNEKAWGSHSVIIGHDASTNEWSQAVDLAISQFGSTPYVLQKFHQGKRVNHPWLNESNGKIEIMEGRVRLCPYYFIRYDTNTVSLSGVLATICPADKKIIHGMSEAIMVPCSEKF